jgi:gluconate 2-dehydrogenase gamma chain
MTDDASTRRGFLAHSGQSLSAGWLSFQLPWIGVLAGCARDDASRGAGFLHLTPAEGRAMEAFAARIIPSDDGTAGADQLGVVYFIDRALGTPDFSSQLPLLRAGLEDLDARAHLAGERRGFAWLDTRRQTGIMRQVERDPFFTAARTLVVIGAFSDPSHGGKKSGAGWMMIGIEHRPSFSAPFGWYDANPDADPPKRAA